MHACIWGRGRIRARADLSCASMSMTAVPIFIVDAFTEKPFSGNPAAVMDAASAVVAAAEAAAAAN